MFNLLLTFDSDKSDAELEQEARLIIDEINKVLADRLIKPLPQIQLEDEKKKMKIGVKVYKPSDLILDEDEE